MRERASALPIFVLILFFILTSRYIQIPRVNGDFSSWSDASSGLPTSGTYFGVTFGDVNNDGHEDIIGASDGNGLRVFLGDGTGSWTAVSSHPAESGGYGHVAVGDYDNDGNLDIFAGSPGNSANSPTGLHVFKGDGDGGFTEVTDSTGLPTTGKWRGVATGDVNKDGNLDLAATNGYSTTDGLHVYTGDGAGVFTDNSNGLPTNQDRGSKVVLADFNNDENLDVAAGGSPGVDVYLGNGGSSGSMSWTESSSGLPSERYTGISAVDFDDDGNLDLVISAYNAGSGVGVRAFRNVNNAESWTSSSSGLPTSGDYIDISTGDFDNDGNMDIVTAGSYSSTYGIHVYYGDGSSWTENSDTLPEDTQYVGNAVGDLDSDGKLDILFGAYKGGGIKTWKNLGAEPQPPTISSTSPSHDSSDVPLNSGISIIFSKEMNTTATDNAITSSPEFSWESFWTSQNTAVTLTPSSNLDLSTRYTIRIGTQAKSADSLFLESPYEFSFTTGGTVDVAPPAIQNTHPSDGASDVGLSNQVTITFSEPMDTAATESAVFISPGHITERSWESGGTRLILTAWLEPETTYTVTISQNAQDFAGNSMTSEHAFIFTTESVQNQGGDNVLSGSTMIILAVIIIVVIVLFLAIFLSRKK